MDNKQCARSPLAAVMIRHALVAGEWSWQTRVDVVLKARVGDFCPHLTLVKFKPSRVQAENTALLTLRRIW